MAARERYMSVDVECVATGQRHDARAVCSIVLVDQHETILLRKTVKPDKPVKSYLTPLTGVRQGDLDNGASLESAIAEVKRLLGPDVVLVGQGIKSDIGWLQLVEGTDYCRSVDLGDMFKTYNPRYGKDFYFSLMHEANTLLRRGTIGDQHDAATDATASIQLFNRYNGNPGLLAQAKQTLLSTRVTPSWAKRNNYRWEGVCMAKFMPSKCFCGAPTA